MSQDLSDMFAKLCKVTDDVLAVAVNDTRRLSFDSGYGISQDGSASQSIEELSTQPLISLNTNGSNANQFMERGTSYKRVVDLLDYLNDDDERLYKTESRTFITFNGRYFRSQSHSFIKSGLMCRLCNQTFEHYNALNQHNRTFAHHFDLTNNWKLLNQSDLERLPYILALEVTEGTNADSGFLCFTIKNNSDLLHRIVTIELRYIFIMDLLGRNMKSIDDCSVLPVLFRWSMSNSEVTLKKSINDFIINKEYQFIIFYTVGEMDFVVHYTFKTTQMPLVKMVLNPLNKYFPTPELRALDRKHYKQNTTSGLLNFNEKELLDKIISHKNAEPQNRLNPENYVSIFNTMLQMEDEVESKRAMSFDQTNQRFQHRNGQVYKLKVSKTSLETAVYEYERLWVTPMSFRRAQLTEQRVGVAAHMHRNQNYIVRSKRNRVYGSIIEIDGTYAYIKFDENLSKFTSKTLVEQNEELYFLRFMNNRTSIMLEHQALQHLQIDQCFEFLFPKSDDMHSVETEFQALDIKGELEWTNSEINDEQKMAVKHIINRTSHPLPFILFGPPGTGKTKTLVETISQILKLNSNSHVLVCASSNSACNEITQRLMTFIPAHSIFRMFSQSVEIDSIPNDICRISNLDKGVHYYPSLLDLYKYKIVICTLTTTGRFVQANISKTHFTHILIDESGSATETQLLVAIAGLCTTSNKVNASIVLTGDPKQLGPVVKSQVAQKMGFGISILERLMSIPPYAQNETTGQYNSRYIIQLIRNYRSHPVILHTPNKLFYNDTLIPMAAENNINWFLTSKLILRSNFPMLFHSVKGVTETKATETSPFNRLEIETVISYVKQLLSSEERSIVEHDIGIISPYRKQSEEIKSKCNANGWKNIKTGAVEVFQGQERPIIIVSLVKSNTKSIGFLDNPKRLNVLLTRAKALLIIIGDATTLSINKNWADVIDYCKINESFIQ